MQNVINNVDIKLMKGKECQVKGHHDKMARTRTNTQNDPKTRTTS